MSELARQVRYSREQFYSLLDQSGIKLEYWGGEVYAMAGGTPEHGRLASRISRQLGNQLESRGCETYSSDVLVRVPAGDVFPDVTVVCGETRVDGKSILNPSFLIEVLSEATAAFDQGAKLEQYKSIASVRAVVFIAQTERWIRVLSRTDTDAPWDDVVTTSGELEIAGTTVSLDAVYGPAR